MQGNRGGKYAFASNRYIVPILVFAVEWPI
jgi:hypothetical protein